MIDVNTLPEDEKKFMAMPIQHQNLLLLQQQKARDEKFMQIMSAIGNPVKPNAVEETPEILALKAELTEKNKKAEEVALKNAIIRTDEETAKMIADPYYIP